MTARLMTQVPVVRVRSELWNALGRLRAGGRTVSLVPTMGALHEGHTSLIEHGAAASDAVVVSIFVNPTQFGPGEDFERYPRDLEADLRIAEVYGADLVFAPDVGEMYRADGPTISVDPGLAGDRLCGPHRPGHFRGVLTVVAKLFGLIRPDVAVFGRKDFQQSVLIRRMVEDLEMGVAIEVAPTVREPDGLALSSRNRYLTPGERTAATRLSKGLFAADRRFRDGDTSSAVLLDTVRAEVGDSEGLELQYAEVVDARSLANVAEASPGDVVALAAFCGETRLIDNVVLGGDPDPRLGS